MQIVKCDAALAWRVELCSAAVRQKWEQMWFSVFFVYLFKYSYISHIIGVIEYFLCRVCEYFLPLPMVSPPVPEANTAGHC